MPEAGGTEYLIRMAGGSSPDLCFCQFCPRMATMDRKTPAYLLRESCLMLLFVEFSCGGMPDGGRAPRMGMQ
jgi:hypothetical protein